MKSSLFALGFFTGTLATYLILTQVWWPDVRLEASRTASQVPAEASPWAAPSAFATPSPWPSLEELMPNPLPSETATPPPPSSEPKSLDLPLLQTDLDRLRMRALLLPVQGVERRSLRDTFRDARGARRHQAMDIMAERGTPVLAAGDGRVEKLFVSRLGGLAIYQFDAQGEYCYYYAHLNNYAAGLDQGTVVRKGDVIGYVGSTGNASPSAPHLHFAIFRLGTEKRWWEGTAINAYPLWEQPAVP